MAGRGKGRPPKIKAAQRAKDCVSKEPSESDLSSSSGSDETLSSIPIPQTRAKSPLSNWVEATIRSNSKLRVEGRKAPLHDTASPTTAQEDLPNSGKQLVRITKEDISDEIRFWESVVVCYVFGANPPLKVIDGFVKRIWKDLSIDKVRLLGKGVFIVRMMSNLDRDKACDMSGILFDKKPFVVKPWTPKPSASKTELKYLLIWVSFPGLELEY